MKNTIYIFSLLLLNSAFVSASSKELENAVQTTFRTLTQQLKTENESIAIPPYLTLDNKTTMLGKLLSEKLINEFTKGVSPLKRGVSEGRGVLIPVERDFIFKLTDEMK